MGGLLDPSSYPEDEVIFEYVRHSVGALTPFPLGILPLNETTLILSASLTMVETARCFGIFSGKLNTGDVLLLGGQSDD